MARELAATESGALVQGCFFLFCFVCFFLFGIPKPLDESNSNLKLSTFKFNDRYLTWTSSERGRSGATVRRTK